MLVCEIIASNEVCKENLLDNVTPIYEVMCDRTVYLLPFSHHKRVSTLEKEQIDLK